MAKQNDVDLLNQLLLGRHMGLDSLHDYIRTAQDRDLSEHLSHMAGVYERQIEELRQKIRDLGGNPDDTRGMAGVMRTVMTRGKLLFDDDSGTITHDVLDGEQMGIGEEEKILAQLSPASHGLVEGQLEENRQILQKLHDLNRRYNA